MKALCLPGVNENTNLRSYYIDRWYCAQRKLRKILRQIKLLCKEYSLLFELVKKEGNKVSWKQNHVQPKSLCFIFCKFRSKKWAFNEQTFQMNCFCCFLVCSVWWYESIWKKEYRIKKGYFQNKVKQKMNLVIKFHIGLLFYGLLCEAARIFGELFIFWGCFVMHISLGIWTLKFIATIRITWYVQN